MYSPPKSEVPWHAPEDCCEVITQPPGGPPHVPLKLTLPAPSATAEGATSTTASATSNPTSVRLTCFSPSTRACAGCYTPATPRVEPARGKLRIRYVAVPASVTQTSVASTQQAQAGQRPRRPRYVAQASAT